MEYPGFSNATCTDIVVTAGGTQEYIDDVRYIGNFSNGGLGHALAQEFVSYGNSVILLAPQSTIDRHGLINGVQHRKYTSAEELKDKLQFLKLAKIVVHAAAVSDYTPERQDGKIRSDQDELTIKLRRTPKILAGLRETFGEKSYIVGFKLLSGVTPEELIETGRQQIQTNNSDMCVANDLQDIGQHKRKVYAIDGLSEQPTPIEASTKMVAHHLASRIMVAAQIKGVEQS